MRNKNAITKIHMNFFASRFNPEKDPHKPSIGNIFHKRYLIGKVETTMVSDLLQTLNSDLDLQGHDEMFIVDNPERPFVKYRVWVNELDKE